MRVHCLVVLLLVVYVIATVSFFYLNLIKFLNG